MRILLPVLLLICFHFSVIGQHWIKGSVTDAQGVPVVGANIFLQDTYDGTSTDVDGHYAFSTGEQGNQVLVATYLGYKEYRRDIQLTEDTLLLEITLKEDAFELESVVITAGAFEASDEGKREVLKPLDIVTTAGVTADIAGALNTLPGTQTVGESGRLFVRGGEGYETKTFIDGMQVMNFYSPSAPNTPGRSRFMPFMFSGTSFSTGGYSAEYGQALSSALILSSKFLATQNRIDLSLMTVGADASITRAWEKASLSAKAQYTNLDPYMGFINQDIDWIDAPTSMEGSAAYRQKISSSGVLKVFGNFNRSSFTLNQYAIGKPEQKTRTSIANQYTYLNTMVQETIGNGWTIKGGFSYTSNRDDIGLSTDEVDQSEKGMHTKLVLSKNLSGNVSIRAGAEYFNRHFYQDFYSLMDTFTNRYNFTENLGAAFAESDIFITKNLLARVGVRTEYNALSEQFHLAPRLSLAFKTSEKSQISAAFGQFQQSPNTEWLMVANDLKAEAADHYILNYQISDQKQTFRIEVFQKNYRNLVRYLPGQLMNPEAYANSGSGYARGFDIFWRDNKTLKNTDYWISYSYLDTERQYRDYPKSATPAFASRHNLSVVYKHFINPLKTQVGATYTFASSRAYTDPNEEGFLNQQTPAYHDISANFSYLLRQNIIIHGSVNNLLGSNQIFGYQFADTPDETGHYASRAIRPPARRFLFLGVFITFSKKAVLNQLPNL